MRQSLITTLFSRTLVRSDLNQFESALADLDRATGFAQELIDRDPDDLGAQSRLNTLDSQKAFVLLGLKQYGQAIALARDLLQRREALLAAEPGDNGLFREVITARQVVADSLREAGQTEQACAVYTQVAREWEDYGARTTVSEVDRSNSLDPLSEYLAQCGR